MILLVPPLPLHSNGDLGPRTTGCLLGFPATLFLLQSYALYMADARD